MSGTIVLDRCDFRRTERHPIGHYPAVSARIVFVRHCESAVNPEAPPATWGLTETGLRQARSLVNLNIEPSAVVAGDEPKMSQSLEPLARAAGVEVTRQPALNESHSEGWFGDHEFLEVVGRFFDHPSRAPAPGWETAEATAGRFVNALRDIVVGLPSGATVVVCSGGRALTATLVELRLIRQDQAYSVWRSIGMPDVAEITLDIEKAVLHSQFSSGRLTEN